MVNSANTRDTRVVVPVALRALEAQRLVSLIAYAISPALAAGLIAYVHMGDVGYALLVAVAMLAALQLVERSTLPLGLMPAARLGLGLCAPVLGAGAAVALALAAGRHMVLAELKAPVAGAWLIMGLGAWVTARFDGDRRARVAVVGSPGFAIDLAEELEAAGIRAYEVIGWFGEARASQTPDGSDVRQLDYLGGLDEVRSAVIGRQIELLVCGRVDHRHADDGVDAGSRSLRPDRGFLPRPAGADDRGEPALRGAASGTCRSGPSTRPGSATSCIRGFAPTSPLSKRCFDLVIALPGWRSSRCRCSAIAAVAIKLTDGGPVLLPPAAARRARSGVRDPQAADDGARTRRPAARSGPRRTTSA